ncbi:recombinase family protein [Deinococcus yunweiensis]|uniref:recombinase family protein n=1 Tax=Deinococcus yunweiensis TaxID=367282 RepID=UPI00398F3F19
MRRFYCYTRVSTLGKQSENTSQHVQLAACKAYGDEQGFIFVDWIHDSQSGIKWEERKGIQLLRQVAESGEITDVIFYKIDRTGRDNEVKSLIEYLYKHGVKVSIAHKSRSYETAYAAIQDNFWEIAVSEYERNTIVERTMSGKLYQFQNGGVIKRPISGYDTRKEYREVNGKRAKITITTINPLKAEAIRYLFKIFLETQSEGATVRAINLKYPDLIQKRDTLRRNLRDSILSNAMAYAGRPVTESFNGHTREYQYDPIIDLATASKTMSYLAAYSRKRQETITPFAGVIRCSCGKSGKASLVPARAHYASSYGYVCESQAVYHRLKVLRATSSERPKCRHNVRISYIISALDKFFEESNSESFLTKYESALTKQVETYNTRLTSLSRLKEYRTDAESKKSQIMESVLNLSGNPEYSSIVKEFAKQIAELEKELAKLTESIRKVSDSVTASRLILDTLGIDLEHFARPVAKKNEDGTVTVLYDGEQHSFKNMRAYQMSEVRQKMKSDLFDSRIFDNLDSLNRRISDLKRSIVEGDWATVNPALKELGIWVTVPFALSDTKKRREGVTVTVDFAPLKAALTQHRRVVQA